MRLSIPALLLTMALATGAAAAGTTLSALPGELETRNPPVVWTVTGPDSLTIDAGAGSNWFATPQGNYKVDSAPTLLFPAAESFALTAKVSLQPKIHWDSGVLALFADQDHWAKLCLEASGDGDGRLQVVSVVTNGVSDDAYSIAAKGDTLYLRVTRRGAAFGFFASEDGKSWQLIRQFRLDTVQDLKAGLLAQSPAGGGMHVTFSEIRYKTGIKHIYSDE